MISYISKITNILENRKSVSLRFLTLEEQLHLSNKTDVKLYGGFNNAERKRAYFFDYKEDNIISYKIIHNDKYLTLSHQNILGTLLSLGITHDSIGDILPRQKVFIITKEISEEVIKSFTKINNVSISLEKFPLNQLHSEQEFEEYRTTLDSLRLDLVVSKITRQSRGKTLEMIDKELIKVNHKIITKNTILIKENDIISIRKYGRFQVNDTKNKSKKGKIILKYAKYI